MLAVAVDPHDALKAVLEREAIGGLHGAAETEMMRQFQNLGARSARHRGGRVARAVVDYDDRRPADRLRATRG